MRSRRTTSLAAAIALAIALAACVPQPARPPAAAPGVHVVPTSIDASGQRDVTAALNDFVRSVPDGATIRLPRNGRLRVDGTLLLEGRRNLILDGNGATLFAVTRGDRNRSHVRIDRSVNVTVRNLTIRGAHPNGGTHSEAQVTELEGQHGVDLRASRSVIITGVTITDVYGDFVYLGGPSGGPWTEHVIIRNNDFARNGRSGIVMVAARDVFIEGNKLREMRRSTFNFEPTARDHGVERVTIRNNDIGPGRLMFVAAGGQGPVHQVTVAENRLRGQNLQFLVHHGLHGNRDGWRVVGNHSDFVSGNPHASLMRFWRVNGLEVRDNHQRFQEGRDMVVAHITNSCNVDVRNNTRPGSVGEYRVEGSC